MSGPSRIVSLTWFVWPNWFKMPCLTRNEKPMVGPENFCVFCPAAAVWAKKDGWYVCSCTISSTANISQSKIPSTKSSLTREFSSPESNEPLDNFLLESGWVTGSIFWSKFVWLYARSRLDINFTLVQNLFNLVERCFIYYVWWLAYVRT